MIGINSDAESANSRALKRRTELRREAVSGAAQKAVRHGGLRRCAR
jgi:hypothetical protein